MSEDEVEVEFTTDEVTIATIHDDDDGRPYVGLGVGERFVSLDPDEALTIARELIASAMTVWELRRP